MVTRRPLADESTLEGQASPEAREQDARSCYHSSLPPTCVANGALEEPPPGELARVIKAGTCMEARLKLGKGEAGMDESQVRAWEGWHHHRARLEGQRKKFPRRPDDAVCTLAHRVRASSPKRW